MIKTREMRWAGYVARLQHLRNVYKIVIEKTERKRTLEIFSSRWEYNNKIDLKLGLSHSGYNPVAECCEDDNET
jgi:hypothetical protein